MFLDVFLTEYDETITSDLNVDPLGLQVIWSVYGQKIFKNRVSSISNDVRNYTINLFHHYLIRELIEDDSFLLSRKLSSVYSKKDLLIFKQACLVHLENIFVYSVIAMGDHYGVDDSAVLGITKARRRWHEAEGNLEITFSFLPSSYVLVRQTTLGVSGRYKTPLVEMGFFDKNYTYNVPSSADLWRSTGDFIEKTPVLSALRYALLKYLKTIFIQDARVPKMAFSDIPDTVKAAYVTAFQSSAGVGEYSREFWLNITHLDKGVAGAMLEVLDREYQGTENTDYSAQQLFHVAKQNILLSLDELIKISHVEMIEPFLADLDLLFTLLLCKKTQYKTDVITSWYAYSRDDNTLPRYATIIDSDPQLVSVLHGTGLTRIKHLLKLRNMSTMDEQIECILQYHSLIMSSRGQASWIGRDEDDLIKNHIKPRMAPIIHDRPSGSWFHQYYIPQFKNLVRGFQGIAT